MNADPHFIAANLAAVRARVDEAARRAGRDPESVRIVAVTKKLGADFVRAAWAAGQRDFGENYVQEAIAKIAELSEEIPGARWHLLGRLQSNKASVSVGRFALLHAIDSESTVAALAKAAMREGATAALLLQVRLGQRGAAAEGSGAARGGVEADDAAAFLCRATGHDGIRFDGLMGVADPDLPARPQFAGLRELSIRLADLGLPHAPLGELSMGMTGDFEAAVAEGATIVRIGTAIFGERPAARAS